MNDDIFELARQVGQALHARNQLLATAESCTGGGVAQAITDIAGSSAWFERGFVTYTNVSKTQMLGVPASLISAKALPAASSASTRGRSRWALCS